ncbi:MAG: PAS domain S-box protein [Myxococcota bacterium]|nr:PAS domain S-box protein [Myxococcota bacterium]
MAGQIKQSKGEIGDDHTTELYKQVVLASPDPIHILQDSRIVFLNPASTWTFGYTLKDVDQGLDFFDLVHEADIPAVRRRYEDRLAGKQVPRTFLISIVAKNGKRVYCETSASLIQFKGRPADLVFIRNMEERKQTEADLASKQRVLQALSTFEQYVHHQDVDSVLKGALDHIRHMVASARVSIALVDEYRNGLVLLQVSGKDSQLPKGKFIPDGKMALFDVIRRQQALYRPNIRTFERPYELDPLLLEGGINSDYLVPLIVEGNCFGTLNSGAAQVDGISPDHRLMLDLLAPRLAVAIRNAQLFETISSNEARIQALLENSEDQIIIIDQHGKMKWSSPSVARMSGYATEELLGSSAFDFVHEDDKGRLYALLDRVLVHPRTLFELEYRAQHADDSWHVYEGTVNNLLRESRIGGIVVNVRNVTDRRALEQEAQRREKLESIGLLAGGLAHDFNNLLTAILGSIDLAKIAIKRGSYPTQHIRAVEGAARKAADLTQQLLAFARGGAPIKKIASIDEIAREAAGLVLHGSNVRCKFHTHEQTWPAEVDPAQMSQVFHNLLINANQAMPDGGIVCVKIENIPKVEAGKDDPQIRVTIADQGCGIDPSDLTKIFDPYYTTKEGGSGLGIPIAYAILKRHGGSFNVRSTPGVGTTFELEIPAKPGADVEEKPGSTPLPRGQGRILVMDDEAIVLDTAAEMLKELGYEAVCVVDGQEAVDAYVQAIDQGNPFKAVIMDLTVPGAMGGKEAVQLILERDPNCVALVSSGYSDDPVMAHHTRFGFAGVVPKPYTLETLGQVLDSVL